MGTKTTVYLIKNARSGVLLGAYEGVDELDAYHVTLAEVGLNPTDKEWSDEIPTDIQVYNPANLDRLLTDDERAALWSTVDWDHDEKGTAA